MPRSLYKTIPDIINSVNRDDKSPQPILEVATRNPGKLKEIKRILKEYEIIGKDLKVDEIQSISYLEVAEKKAKEAWEKNGYNPILVEDVSLEIKGLGGRPGTYVIDFCSEVSMREDIAKNWLRDGDRTAIARATYALFDGTEVHLWEGAVGGLIPSELRGTNDFGWGDMFIPNGSKKTFAEMVDEQKDKYSMRAKALLKFKANPPNLSYPVFQINEPYAQELERTRFKKLQNQKAIEFAFSLEAVEQENEPNKDFWAPNYSRIEVEMNKFYTRFSNHKKSSSLGILLTDIDRKSLKTFKNGSPMLWQMGPERRQLALAQRAEFFLEHQNDEVLKALEQIELRGIQPRNNHRSVTVETALGTNTIGDVTQTKALKEIGYKKISSDQEVSRSEAAYTGLYTKIGKYARSVYGIGSMPPVSGWRDVLVMSAISHMPVFTHRNSLNAVDPTRQIKLIKEAKDTIRSLNLSTKLEMRSLLNIGAAIGCGNISEEIATAKELYKKAGVKLFRIYTINGDPRVVEIARRMRQELGEDIEIFVGQIADVDQAHLLIEPEIKADGLIFGHGGGMQCTSATNGMALTTLEEIYSVITDPRFNKTTVVAEGGVGRSVGGLIVMGIDLILCNQKFVKGTIEVTDLFFEHKNGDFCHPYHGSASAPTMLIESSNPKLLEARMSLAGRAKKVEGKPGYMFFPEKAGSMAFHVNEFKHYAARALADLGVKSIAELREFLQNNKSELLRMISTEAAYIGNPHTE